MEKTLLHTLETLKKGSFTFKEVAEALFVYDYPDFNDAFNIDSIQVEEETYQRVPIFSSDTCCAILMIWGVNNQTAIHDHKNYQGLIKVLKGTLSEASYQEKDDFIIYESIGNADTGAIFSEDIGGIHSIINRSPEISVGLHIYSTPQTSLTGVRIFDIKNKRIAILNNRATICSWKLPQEAYEGVIVL